jgi:hypothetical protein
MMLSAARIATRQVAVRRTVAMPFAAVRAASSFSGVPQGPPVSYPFPTFPPLELPWRDC